MFSREFLHVGMAAGGLFRARVWPKVLILQGSPLPLNLPPAQRRSMYLYFRMVELGPAHVRDLFGPVEISRFSSRGTRSYTFVPTRLNQIPAARRGRQILVDSRARQRMISQRHVAFENQRRIRYRGGTLKHFSGWWDCSSGRNMHSRVRFRFQHVPLVRAVARKPRICIIYAAMTIYW